MVLHGIQKRPQNPIIGSSWTLIGEDDPMPRDIVAAAKSRKIGRSDSLEPCHIEALIIAIGFRCILYCKYNKGL